MVSVVGKLKQGFIIPGALKVKTHCLKLLFVKQYVLYQFIHNLLQIYCDAK